MRACTRAYASPGASGLLLKRYRVSTTIRNSRLSAVAYLKSAKIDSVVFESAVEPQLSSRTHTRDSNEVVVSCTYEAHSQYRS